MQRFSKMFMKITISVVILILPGLFSCSEASHKKHKLANKEAKILGLKTDEQNSLGAGTIDCDTAIWKYVYNRTRLEVIDLCKTVTGVVVESNADEDGDQHMLLKLDSGQKDLLTKKNKKKKDGNLVIEAVCINKIEVKKVGNTCNGYVNHILLPNVGDHVRVTGSLVNDSHNGWNEIHPITKLEIIK